MPARLQALAKPFTIAVQVAVLVVGEGGGWGDISVYKVKVFQKSIFYNSVEFSFMIFTGIYGCHQKDSII